MNKLLALLFLIVLAGCGEKGSVENSESKNILENLAYSVDTLVVDAGGELLSISSEYILANTTSLSADQRFFYFFNKQDYTLAVVDLDQLKLVEVLPFEKEGPDGVGEYIEGLQALPDGRFLITGVFNAAVFTREGKKLTDIPLTAEEYKGVETDLPIYLQLMMSSDEHLFFSLTGYDNIGSKNLVLLNHTQKTGKIFDLPEIVKAEEFDISLENKSLIIMAPITIQDINDHLYVSVGYTSSIYRYDYRKDSIQLITFPHQLVPSAKSGSVRNEVATLDELFDEMKKISTQISFDKLLWDSSSQRFFRLGSKVISSSIKDNTTYESEVYLFIYDENLNLLGEKLLENLPKPPRFYFMKDGKLYSYVNVEDELGFAVFTFDF